MIDSLRALLAERAAALAEHDGVPVAARHVHAALHELTMLAQQARDLCLRDLAAPAPQPAAAAVAEPARAEPTGKEPPEPDPVGAAAPAHSTEPEAHE